jgi:peptide-methionine (S)-S-oxide reductase
MNDESPLFAAVRRADLDEVRRLLDRGANPRLGNGEETPLHVAARSGPLALVELLLVGGALEWQTDAQERTPLEVALDGQSPDRDAIVALLDRDFIADDAFRAAVTAVVSGDVAALGALLDAQPRLLRERIAGPPLYRTLARRQYFLDPKLFWFVANNPTKIERMPPNMVEVAQAMIARGVEKDDLDYALALVMTSDSAREAGLQAPLMHALLDAGATASDDAIDSTAAHGELDALRTILGRGVPLDAPIAAAIGESERLPALLRDAGPTDIARAFGLAAINGNVAGVRLALDAGADVDAYVPIHTHATALHQGAILDSVALIDLLLDRGARIDQRDKLFDATPLDWAIYSGSDAARAALERRSAVRD